MLVMDEVRHILDFSSKNPLSIDQSFFPHNNESSLPSTISDEIETEHYSLQKHVAKLLR